jgi:hypothetical protein
MVPASYAEFSINRKVARRTLRCLYGESGKVRAVQGHSHKLTALRGTLREPQLRRLTRELLRASFWYTAAAFYWRGYRQEAFSRRLAAAPVFGRDRDISLALQTSSCGYYKR